ncbi:hypothetical protein ACFL7M_09100 [Thermodesulfobacteriota bacterium]
MTSVSYRLSGSGSWQNLLPDESSRQLYAKIYLAGASLSHVSGQLRQLLNSWQKAAIVKFKGQKVLPLGPIMMNSDLDILDPWFQDISASMCEAVLERLPEYHSLSSRLAGGRSTIKQELDNILTIQICAHTLDSCVFALLRKEMIGTYPSRGFAGNFFFWGYAFASGPKRIFGFTTYGSQGVWPLHVIRSHDLNRRKIKALLRDPDILDYILYLHSTGQVNDEAVSGDYSYSGETGKIVDSLRDAGILDNKDPPHLAIPVFKDRDMASAIELYQDVSLKIITRFVAKMKDLKSLVGKCSFNLCSWPDIFCMLFHLAYSYAADKLVERGTIPDFPQNADGKWGVWIR